MSVARLRSMEEKGEEMTETYAELTRDAMILATQSETLLIEAHYLRTKGSQIVERYLRPLRPRLPAAFPSWDCSQTERSRPQYPVTTPALAIVREMDGYTPGEMY